MGFLFVDDTDLVILGKSARVPVREIVATTQARVTAWQGGLRATGGALHPDKCSWVLVDYSWCDGKWQYSEFPANLYVNDFNGQQTVVTRHPATKAIKVVGIHQALNGNMKEQVKGLKEKARDWGTKIRAGNASCYLAHQAGGGKQNFIDVSLFAIAYCTSPGTSTIQVEAPCASSSPLNGMGLY